MKTIARCAESLSLSMHNTFCSRILRFVVCPSGNTSKSGIKVWKNNGEASFKSVRISWSAAGRTWIKIRQCNPDYPYLDNKNNLLLTPTLWKASFTNQRDFMDEKVWYLRRTYAAMLKRYEIKNGEYIACVEDFYFHSKEYKCWKCYRVWLLFQYCLFFIRFTRIKHKIDIFFFSLSIFDM